MQWNPFRQELSLTRNAPSSEIMFISTLISLPLSCSPSLALPDNFLLSWLPSSQFLCFVSSSPEKPHLTPGTRIHLPHFLLEASESSPTEKATRESLTLTQNLSAFFPCGCGREGELSKLNLYFLLLISWAFLELSLSSIKPGHSAPWIFILLSDILAPGWDNSHREERQHTFKWSSHVNTVPTLPSLPALEKL